MINLPKHYLHNNATMTIFFIMWYLSAHGAYAQLANPDQSEKSCRDLGHCRSIWDIIWSCLATIFSCAWVSLHLNVPEQGKGKLWKFARRVSAFGVALLAPEWIIARAWEQWETARKIATEHEDYKWTLTHGFFINMGGFMVRDVNGDKEYVLHPDDINTYLLSNRIDMTEEDIQDKSKGDMLTKGFVVLQTSWFILQLIARAMEHLPITELEIATLAFATLNGVTYALWWNKPLDVECPIIIAHYTLAEHVDVGADGNIGQGSIDRDHTEGGTRAPLIIQRGHRQHRRVSSVPFLDSGVGEEHTSTSIYILAAIGVVFGSIHCIAWASHFPTAPERLLWQIASIITFVSPTCFAVWVLMPNYGLLDAMGDVIVVFGVILYIIARLFLLILAFTTLRSLPLDAYTTVQWTTFVPHV